MSRQKTSNLFVEVLAVVIMLAFTVWISWAEGPLLALAPLTGAVWLAIQIKREGKSKTASIVVLSLAAAVLILVAVYFAWISSFTF